jgi:hypothetical protein
MEINDAEYEFDFGTQNEGLDEMEQLEAAAQLLEVRNDQEMEDFLGDVFSKIGQGISDFAHSSTGQALGGILKSAAKKALPVLGGAAGGVLGGPLGATVGSWAADKAGQMMGLELEGLSNEDKQFEVAQQFVKLANEAARAAAVADGTASPDAVARRAFISAAQRHAPGLIRPATNGAGKARTPQVQIGVSTGVDRGSHDPGPEIGRANIPELAGARTGRWHRHGDKIVLIGV